MNIFIIIVAVVSATIAGIFFRTTWENYKEEGVILTRYWYKTIPIAVTYPLCCGIFFFFMSFFCLVINFA